MKITIKQISCLVIAVTTLAMVGCTTSSRGGRTTGQYIDDKSVARNVKSALNKDTLTDTSDIHVQAFRGNVHLTGMVQYPIQKEQASKITRRVNGVQYFKNDIIVQGELPTTRAAQGSAIREPSGAEMESSQSSQGSGWEPGNHSSKNQQIEVSEPSGAETETEVKLKRDGAEIDVDEVETENKVEKK